LPEYVVSAAAVSDVRSFIRYTAINSNAEQAGRYNARLCNCFRMLAEHPGSGRACGSISNGLHGFEHGKHVVFYRNIARGISITRVLNQRMIP